MLGDLRVIAINPCNLVVIYLHEQISQRQTKAKEATTPEAYLNIHVNVREIMYRISSWFSAWEYSSRDMLYFIAKHFFSSGLSGIFEKAQIQIHISCVHAPPLMKYAYMQT